MRFSPPSVLAAGFLCAGLTAPALGQVTETLIDFEAPGFDATSGSAIGDAGFDFFFSSSGGTEAFPDFAGFIPAAPGLNIEAPAIVTVAFNDADGNAALAGDQSLVFFTDVNSGLFTNADDDPRILNLNVFQQQNITAADIGSVVTYDFLFSGAPGSTITAPTTTVEAFLLTLDPNNGFATTNELAFDLSGAVEGVTQSGSLTLDLSDAALNGQTLQFGIRNSAADFENPAVIVDNLSLTVPEPASLALLGVGALALVSRRRSAC